MTRTTKNDGNGDGISPFELPERDVPAAWDDAATALEEAGARDVRVIWEQSYVNSGFGPRSQDEMIAFTLFYTDSSGLRQRIDPDQLAQVPEHVARLAALAARPNAGVSRFSARPAYCPRCHERHPLNSDGICAKCEDEIALHEMYEERRR